jgi:transcriptional regulator NrdR family protein
VKCPQCGAWTDVLETRSPRRRRECANGHRFTTIELPDNEAASYLAEQAARRDRYLRGKAKLIELGYLQPDTDTEHNGNT